MRVPCRLFLSLLAGLVLGVPSLGTATPFYVAPPPTGAPAPGRTCGQAQSPSTPFSIINDAIGCMSGGDTVEIATGTYLNEYLGDHIHPGGGGEQPIPHAIPKGSSSQWTTIKAAPGATVWLFYTVSAGASGRGQIHFSDDNVNMYIQFQGLNMDLNNVGSCAIQVGSQSEQEYPFNTIAGPRNITFMDMEIKNVQTIPLLGNGFGNVHYKRLYVHDWATNCGDLDNGCHGIYFLGRSDNLNDATTGFLLEDSIFAHQHYKGAGYGLQMSSEGKAAVGIVRNTVIYDVANGLNTGGGAAYQLYNNIWYGLLSSPYQGEVQLAGGEFYNNVIHNAPLVLTYGSGQTVRNNLILGSTADIAIRPGDEDNVHPGTMSNNLCPATHGLGCTGTGTPSGIWVSPGSNDYRLKSGTNAVGTGANLSGTLTKDMTGATRPGSGNWDLGPCMLGATQCAAAGATPSEPPEATSLRFNPQPGGGLVGQPMAFSVEVLDQFGTVFDTDNTTITVVIGNNPGSATLTGDNSNVTANGAASFSLSLSATGIGYTLVAQASGFENQSSNAFTITDPVPTRLGFEDDPPAATPVGATMAPIVVQIRDDSGAIVTTSTRNVTLALQQNPAGGTLSGTLTRAAVGGRATFDNLSVNTVGTDYTFGATSPLPAPPLQTDQSGFFAITTGGVLTAPSQLRSLEETIAANGQIRLGWDYAQGSTPATGYVVQRQEACTGTWTDRPNMPMPVMFQMGTNMSGADFGPALPGIHGQDYVYPDPDYCTVNCAPGGGGYTGQAYFKGKGMNSYRLGFKHERLQQTLGGALDSAELTRLTTTVGHLTSNGHRVVIEPHNFARYNLGGTLYIVGSATFTNAHFRDFWSKVANVFKTNAQVAFDLSNEPNSMDTNQWLSAANEAIDAIRDTGATNRIHVEGNGYSHAFTWVNNAGSYPAPSNAVAMLNITDASNNTVFSVHEYLQPDPSQGPDTQGCASATIGPERLAPFTTWLRTNNKKGMLGEFAGNTSATCLSAIAEVMRYVRANSDVYHGWTWYSAGPWWGTYVFTLEPTAGPTDQPQMDVMEPFLAEAQSVAQTYTDMGLSAAQTYCWRVAAVDAGGARSAPSNVYQWPTTIPPPTNLTISTFSTGFFIQGR